MATYIGFSTVGANELKSTNMPISINGGVGGILYPVNTGKKYKIVDVQLVLQDFINALNIRRGEKVGQPGYGTTIWDFAFEPNTQDVQYLLKAEVERVANLDPRMKLDTVQVYTSEHGIMVQIEMSVKPFVTKQTLTVYFDSQSRTATQYES